MLKLKKVQILGFKSFCDRTELQLTGQGIAAVVGPNGCGKSNISDAITWVLGEQSAKSLRGIKMEDVIFAGTRDRKPTGMAEVSLTLVDPEVYDGNTLAEGEEVFSDAESPTPIDSVSDWDESAVRAEAAQETEDATLEAQPGTTYEAEGPVKKSVEGEADASAELKADPNNVVLKIRRRKFGRSPVRAGEITVTRRLFRSGDSEYLLNGKICRLRDIQDIFMGTGLGGESYAMIGQERIGQLLSSKPLDRRAIIEEAAGITRFKTKKRLAELRLESAKQNLSRVNDIFEEVTRQMGVLKRQASKAERYGALREELRGKLRVVLASRLTQMDAEQSAATTEIARLAGLVDAQAAQLETMDAEHSTGVARGYELDGQIREAGARANSSAVELERIAARTASNNDRVAELTQRMESGNEDLAQSRGQLEGLAGEREQHRSFLESATSESTAARDAANAQQAQAHEATRNVLAAEALAENQRRNAMQSMQRAGQANNEIAQAEAALAGLDRENERLSAESATARGELEQLGTQRGQLQISFEDVTSRLKRLEAEISELRQTLDSKRIAETQSRRRGDELRAQQASFTGRRSSLEALIREHSYSTDTVRNIFRATAKNNQPGTAPIGTLADFLEVDGKYEEVVDEFLREELNYIVVRDWDAADEGVRLLQKDVAGRATFLVHPDGAHVSVPEASSLNVSTPAGVVALKDCIRVLDGFGRSLETFLPKLREGFIAPDSATARSLAAQYPQAFFLSPNGETFHNVTVTGGKPREQGPLALKRELAELQTKLEGVEAELTQSEQTTADLAHQIADHTAAIEAKNHERRDAERESANSGAALRQMEQEVARIESRLKQWEIAAGRNNEGRQQRLDLIARKREEAAKFEAERATIEQQVSELSEKIADHTAAIEAKNYERRDAERESANSGAALRQMEQEVARIESRLKQWEIAAGRNNEGRQQRLDLIARKREESAKFEAERATIEQQVSELSEKIVSLRLSREELQVAASSAAAALAGLEERRRNANANFEQTNRLYESQSQRIAQLESQLTAAAQEKQRREEETAELALKHNELTEMRAQAIAEGETLSSEASALRASMTELDTKLRTLRHETEELREQRAALTARAAKLSSDLEHLEATCVNDLSVEPIVLREDASIERIEAEALATEEEAARGLKQRLEAMGPVNMMALEEYTETAERHGFLETQRKDLLDSIENTQQSIKEIDDVSRIKFDEAYKIINDNFSATFTKLFGGGAAFMRLTEVDPISGKSSDASGIDIIASPPGKKMQNVLLLSGGEKALTALSLLVGIFQFQPAPFCVLDEVDAPLDETNVGRFSRLIAEMAETTQFIVITHSKRTMEQADVMYGVTMQEPGVSKIVSVSLGGRSKGREARNAA